MSASVETQAWQWLQRNMPIEVSEALARFVSVNPQFGGAEWWDVLDIMRDCDAHLDVIEHMVEAMPEWTVLHTYVTLTLIYASQSFCETYTNEMRVIGVRATIDDNGPVMVLDGLEPDESYMDGTAQGLILAIMNGEVDDEDLAIDGPVRATIDGWTYEQIDAITAAALEAADIEPEDEAAWEAGS